MRSWSASRLLGLESAISVGVTHPVRTTRGWEFLDDPEGVDPVLRIRFLGEAYAATDPSYTGRATVPALVDVTTGHVVQNDYHRLTNHLETAWAPLHAPDAPDLYPAELRADIDALNDVLFDEVDNGVYKCAFARSQAAYEAAYDVFWARMDELETRLSTQRFLFGDRLTDSDVRLFVTLVRFDAAYHGAFTVNRNRLTEMPALWGYARDLYQRPGFADTTSFEGIKAGYYLLGREPGVRPSGTGGIVPKGPDPAGWTTPHGREWLGG